MREVVPEASWPQSWIVSYTYDREEVFGTPTNWGYALAYRNRRQETLKLVTEAIEPGATVLDLAAAQGNFTLALAERGYRVTWNDLRADLAGYVQKKHERGEVAYAAGNAFELNFADGVPLCRSHHRAVHRASDEQAWWKATGIDPVEAACHLWRQTRLNDPRDPHQPGPAICPKINCLGIRRYERVAVRFGCHGARGRRANAVSSTAVLRRPAVSHMG
jgi:SAM-dependent methyltransferase